MDKQPYSLNTSITTISITLSTRYVSDFLKLCNIHFTGASCFKIAFFEWQYDGKTISCRPSLVFRIVVNSLRPL